ncbi:hypothetical protein COLO4_10173 [Corchorus olitorius]|uniref:Uncharacterized protein n=1 Tax=Corchorus olitorius TaxID=93759 RepID=A0A1R3K9S3_9ROSI|nr:hypothetical protein COLO4_10173 [Corchorus olitorius]
MRVSKERLCGELEKMRVLSVWEGEGERISFKQMSCQVYFLSL